MDARGAGDRRRGDRGFLNRLVADGEDDELEEPDPLVTALDAAARMISVGLDGISWLSTGSSSDRLILNALAQRLQNLERRRNSDLATAIINKLGEAMR